MTKQEALDYIRANEGKMVVIRCDKYTSVPYIKIISINGLLYRTPWSRSIKTVMSDYMSSYMMAVNGTCTISDSCSIVSEAEVTLALL